MTTRQKLKSLGLDRHKLAEFFSYKPGSFDSSTRREKIEAGVLKVVEHVMKNPEKNESNKETLQPFHFITPERPKEEDYNFGYDPVIDAQYYGAAMDEFQKALAEWESLYEEEPKFNYGSGSFDKSIHQRWKDHQVRYKGWKLCQSSYQNFVKDGVAITFIDNDRIIIADTLKRYNIYQGPCSTKLFELIFEENGIEL